MALDPVPWFIGGGASHGPEVARMLAYAATSGSEGVISTTDLRVTALPTPGASVRVYPGGAAVLNRYSGAPNQTYTVRSPSATDVAIPATGSGGGATRYVILRVDDPQYGGQAPANLANGPYVRYDVVSSITNLAYPFIALAKITQPANTATITGAMITDLRVVANPREKQIIIPRPTLANDAASGMSLTATGADGEWFPNAGGVQYIDVPEWASRMQVEATWISVLLGPEGSSGWGDYWVDFGPTVSSQKLKYSTHKFRWDMPVGDYSRSNWVLAHDLAVPADLRGVTGVQFVMKARKEGAAVPKIDHRSGVVLKVRFLEVAELSAS
ncbi:MAG: hypothetical protein ABS888_00280 [Eubacteriales bacterium]